MAAATFGQDPSASDVLVEVDGKEEPSSDYVLTRVYDLGAYDPDDTESEEGYDYAESEAGYDYAELSEPKAALEANQSDATETRRYRKLSEEGKGGSATASHDYVLSLADGLSWRGGETLRITLARGSLIGATGGLIERASFSATLVDLYPPEMTAHIISEVDINAGR